MSDTIHQRLAELGHDLPSPMSPVATYVPYVITGNLLFISGQGPVRDGKFLSLGSLGRDLTVEQGIDASKLTALNLLSQANAALSGKLSRIKRCVKIFGLVQSTPTFTEQHLVINGASDLLAEVLGDGGLHARAAVASSSLPFNTSVEIDAVFEVRQ